MDGAVRDSVPEHPISSRRSRLGRGVEPELPAQQRDGQLAAHLNQRDRDADPGGHVSRDRACDRVAQSATESVWTRPKREDAREPESADAVLQLTAFFNTQEEVNIQAPLP